MQIQKQFMDYFYDKDKVKNKKEKEKDKDKDKEKEKQKLIKEKNISTNNSRTTKLTTQNTIKSTKNSN